MIKQILIVIALVSISSNAVAQKIDEKKLMGSWDMVIDIDAAMKDAKKDLNLFEKMIVSSVSGFVDQVLEMVDITIEFKPKGKALLKVDGPDVENKETNDDDIMMDDNANKINKEIEQTIMETRHSKKMEKKLSMLLFLIFLNNIEY
ncbi:MAG: hypothetical protein ACPG59_03525, partial [Flavobacteriaceae bacterium]